MRPCEILLTKSQVKLMFSGWECKEPVPPKGETVYVCFPGRAPMDVDLAQVSITDKKSDRGERLWSLVQSSFAGRQFDADVQEAHVLAYRAAQYTAHLERKAGERTIDLLGLQDSHQEDLPLWTGAKEAYAKSYAMLKRMAVELGHVTIKRDSKGQPVGSEASQDMRDIIDALNKGNEEQVKGNLVMGRTYGWVVA